MARAHCWHDFHEWLRETYGVASDEYIDQREKPSASCLLWDGHEGPHEWTDDTQIVVRFGNPEIKSESEARDGG